MSSYTFQSAPIDPEPFYQGSTKQDDHRVFGESAAAAMAASETPYDDLIKATYMKSVEKIKQRIIIPPKVGRAPMMFALYHAILLERLPVNYTRLEAASPDPTAHRTGVIPFMFRCPHPTKAEIENFMTKWPELRTKCEELAPGYVFEPYVMHGNKPSDSVMMAVIMVRNE